MDLKGLIVSLLMAGAGCAGDRCAAESHASPVDVDGLGATDRMVVTAGTGRELMFVGKDGLNVVGRIGFPAELTGTAVTADGKRLFVTGGGPEGRVWVVDGGSGELAGEIATGHSPTSPVLSPDGKRLFVCERFDDSVAVIDVESGELVKRVAVIREPFAADVSKDGRKLYVANLLPRGRADADYVAAAVSVVDTETWEVTKVPLVNGAVGVRGIRVSPDGRHVFVTHVLARYQVPTTQLDRGWVATNALAIIRTGDGKLLGTVLLDDLNLGFANPWAIGFSDDGGTLVVSAAGSHELGLIDLPGLLAKVEGGGGVDDPPPHNDLTYLTGLRKRVPLALKGPRAIRVEGGKAWVAGYFSDTLEEVDLTDRERRGGENRVLELNPGMEMSAERRGELYFHDGSLCFQQWLSCSTCHPDARVDALNWDLLNDGIGNPKNVKSMLYTHRTAPTTWLGARANAEVSVRAGIRHIQFAVRPEEDAEAIDAYLRSLRPLPSPRLVDGRLSESAERGRGWFETLDCTRCHEGELMTDQDGHKVGTLTGVDVGKLVDTPSLIELWRTAPYLHDGSAATVRDVLTTESHGDIYEKTKGLSATELDDLEEYLMSL
nr:cell surface protein [Verrucomicrobiota bacterium JB025]